MLTKQDLVNLLSSFQAHLLQSGASKATYKNYSADLRTILERLPSEGPILSEHIASALEDLKTVFSEATIRRFTYSLKAFTGWLEGNGYNLVSQAKSIKTVQTVSDPVQNYISTLEKEGASQKTIQGYKKDLVSFFSWNKPSRNQIDNRSVERVNSLDIKRYINYLSYKNFSDSSIKRYLFSLRNFFKNEKKDVVYDNNPVKPYLTNQDNQKLPRWKRWLNYRPSWWHAYRGHPASDYFNLGLSGLTIMIVGLMVWQGLFAPRPIDINNLKTEIQSGLVLAATPPRVLSFQGRLTEPSGTPVTSNKTVVFKIYDAESAGTLLWTSKNWSVTPDSNGIFSVCLGGQDTGDDCLLDGVADTAIADSIFRDNAATYLEITVAGEVLSPRQRIAASPYALNTDNLDGIDSTQFLRSDTSDNFTSGTLTTDSGTTLDINGTLAWGGATISEALNLNSQNITAIGTTLTAAAGVTLSTTTTGALTLDSGTTGGVNLGTGNNAKTIAIGTGTAGNTINIGTNNTTLDTINIGSALDDVAITGDQWSVTNAGVLTVVSCSGCGGGGSTLQSAYDAGNTITTTTGRNIAITLAAGLASPTSFSITNNHISNATDFQITNANASGTNTNAIAISQTGAGTLTNGLTISRSAGTLSNAIAITGAVGNGISIDGASGALTIATGVNIGSATGGISVTTGYKYRLNSSDFTGAISGTDGVLIDLTCTTCSTGTTTLTNGLRIVGSDTGVAITNGINFGGATGITTDLVLQNSETISNDQNGEVEINGVLSIGSAVPNVTQVGLWSVPNIADFSGTSWGAIINSTLTTAHTDHLQLLVENAGVSGGSVTNNTGLFIANQTRGGTTDYGIYLAGADTVGICVDCDGTYSFSTVSGGIQWGTDSPAQLFRSAASTLSFGTTTTLTSPGSLTIDLNNASADALTITNTAAGVASLVLDEDATITLGDAGGKTILGVSDFGIFGQHGNLTADAHFLFSIDANNNDTGAQFYFRTNGVLGNDLLWLTEKGVVTLFNSAESANTLTSGTIFSQSFTNATTQAGAYTGLSFDLSTNITNSTQNQTGILLTLKDGSSSGTATGINLAGTFDAGISFTGTLSSGGADITSASNRAITITPAGSGDLVIGTDSDTEIHLSGASSVVKLTATDNTGSLSLQDNSSNTLFQFKDLSTNFGGIAYGGAFANLNSYWSEEFDRFRATPGCTNDTTGARGGVGNSNSCTASTGPISTAATLGTGASCAFRSVADSNGGYEEINAADGTGNAACLEYIGSATANDAQLIFNSSNLPVALMKVRPSNSGSSNARYFVGLGNLGTAGSGASTDAQDIMDTSNDSGIYFSNCTNPTSSGTCGDTTWNATLQNNSSISTVDCGVTISTTNFAVMRIEVVSAGASAATVNAYVDGDVSDGISWTACPAFGSVTVDGLAWGWFAMTHANASLNSNFNFHIDFVRVWQDDAPSSPIPPVEQQEFNSVETGQSKIASETAKLFKDELTSDFVNNLLSSTSDVWYNSAGEVVAWVSNTGEAVLTKVTALVGDFNKLVFGEAVIKKEARVAGEGSFSSGETEIEIESNKIAEDSLINLTPITKTNGLSLYIKEKKEGVGFVVALERNSGDQPEQATASASQTIKFNWFILNQE